MGGIDLKPLVYGILAAFCFSFTYLLNRSLGMSGGHWQWAACLRYLFMIPLMLPIILYRHSWPRIIGQIKKNPVSWIIWAHMAYVAFYVPLSIGSTYSPSWLVAATWEVTLIAGILMSPLFFETVETPDGPKMVRHKVPIRSLWLSGLIVVGVTVVQMDQAAALGWREMLIGALPIFVAATAYPLGNRKTMELAAGQMDAFERVFALTVLTLPFWLALAAFNVVTIGLPSPNELVKSFEVSFVVSIVGTIFFFKAMEMVAGNMQKLAAVEATQSMEIVFTLVIGMLFMGESLPSPLALLGIALVILGIVFYSKLISQPEHHRVVKRTTRAGKICIEAEDCEDEILKEKL